MKLLCPIVRAELEPTMKIMIVMFLLIIALQNVFALGVAPARKVIHFEPGLSQEVTLRILNSQNKDMDVLISKGGELSEYVTLDTKVISFTSDEKEKSFTYKVELPQKIEQPGDHDVEIIMTEAPEHITGKDPIMIGARAFVISQLRIRVPYPGKYAEADLFISASDDRVLITIPIFNLGTKDIIASAKIKILGADDKELASIDTNSIEIKSKDSSKITAHWSAPSMGAYKAIVEVYYDNKVIKLEKDFYVGDIFVKIIDVIFGEFKLGEVVKFDIIVQSGWNEMIKDVYAEVFIKNKRGYTLDILRTAYNDIDALSKQNLTVYWDTKEVSVGEYDFVIKLNYAGKRAEKRIEVNVQEEAISITPVIPKPPKIPIKIIIIISVLVIVIIILSIVIYLKRKMY